MLDIDEDVSHIKVFFLVLTYQEIILQNFKLKHSSVIYCGYTKMNKKSFPYKKSWKFMYFSSTSKTLFNNENLWNSFLSAHKISGCDVNILFKPDSTNLNFFVTSVFLIDNN